MQLHCVWLHPLAVLDETNFLGVAPEALPATHEAILPDQPVRIPTDPASTRSRAVILGMCVPDVRVTHPLSLTSLL